MYGTSWLNDCDEPETNVCINSGIVKAMQSVDVCDGLQRVRRGDANQFRIAMRRIN
jgi:hypothetical protein